MLLLIDLEPEVAGLRWLNDLWLMADGFRLLAHSYLTIFNLILDFVRTIRAQ
jgi:hypothetical protein